MHRGDRKGQGGTAAHVLYLKGKGPAQDSWWTHLRQTRSCWKSVQEGSGYPAGNCLCMYRPEDLTLLCEIFHEFAGSEKSALHFRQSTLTLSVRFFQNNSESTRLSERSLKAKHPFWNLFCPAQDQGHGRARIGKNRTRVRASPQVRGTGIWKVQRRRTVMIRGASFLAPLTASLRRPFPSFNRPSVFGSALNSILGSE